jgi:hypothetical protein
MHRLTKSVGSYGSEEEYDYLSRGITESTGHYYQVPSLKSIIGVVFGMLAWGT